MKRVLFIIVVVIILVLLVGVFWFMNSGPDLKSVAHRKQPRISEMKSQKMIEVRLKGDPNTTSGKAYGQLFKVFYQLKNNQLKQAAPKARWPISVDSQKSEWIGIFGLPVSDTVIEVPAQKTGPQVNLTTWEYGTVAEILHVGPYSTELPTIEKLKNYIKENGYGIVGDHEEEYLKGPGFLPVNTKDYLTIIRYRVRKE
jgi:effector-binding domain-containing protein